MREGGWQRTIGPELAGRTLGLARARPARRGGWRAIAHGVRDGGDRLEPEPRPPRRAAEAGADARRRATSCSSAPTCSRSTSCSATARAGWSAPRELALMKPTRATGQHLARADRRRGRAARRAARGHDRRRRRSTSTTTSRCRATTRCARRRARCSPRTSATYHRDLRALLHATPSRTSPPGCAASRARAEPFRDRGSGITSWNTASSAAPAFASPRSPSAR